MWRLDPWSGGGALTARISGEALRLEVHASRDGRFYTNRITGDGVDVYMSRSRAAGRSTTGPTSRNGRAATPCA